MASCTTPLALLLLSTALLFSVCSGSDDNSGMTHLHFYFHEIPSGANQSSYPVTSLFPNSTFGVIRVFDNAMIEGPDPTSKIIGRVQGIDVGTSLGVESLMTSINFVFSAGDYNGSSLAIMGRSSADSLVNEHSVVGGSGKFRMARGYALSQVVSYTDLSLVVEFNFYVYV